jgi:hypothetical protein
MRFGAGPVVADVLLAAASAGLLASLPFVGPAGRRLGVTGAIVAGFDIMATGDLQTAAPPWLIAAVTARVLRGLAIPLADTHVTTYLQRTAPPQLLGRVLANVYGGVGRRGSHRLSHWRPHGGCYLPAHSLRDGRLWWLGRRGHHCRAAPQGAASARHPIALGEQRRPGLLTGEYGQLSDRMR